MKKIMSLVLILSLVLSVSIPVNARETDVIQVKVEDSTVQSLEKAANSDEISMTIMIDGKESIVKGTLYPFTEGLKNGKLILGEFAKIDEFVINDFRVAHNSENLGIEVIDKVASNKPLISVELITNNGDTVSIQSNISNSDFNRLFNSLKTTAKLYEKDEKLREKYLDKLVQLDTGFNDIVTLDMEYVGEDSIERELEGESDTAMFSVAAMSSSKTQLSDFSYTELKNFIVDLKNSGSSGINISNYGIAESLFTTTGYNFGDNNSSRPFHSAAKYTSNNGGGVYYTRLTMSDIEFNNNFSGSTIFDAWLSMTVKYGVMIEYVQGTNTAKLYLDDYGLKIKDVELAISKLTGNTNNIFINRKITGRVSDNNYDISGLIGLIPETEYLLAFWGVFSVEGTNQFNEGPFDFGNTVSEQLTKYNKVVRGISMDSNSSYMRSESDRMRIEGTIKFSTTCSYNWGYKYTVSTF
jgi:hypothetical protein